MSIQGIRRALRIRFARRHLEREVDEEIGYHVARRAEQLRAAGMSPDEAVAEARRRFGDLEMLRGECLREDTAELRKDSFMSILENIAGDLRFAGRSLKRAPVFTAIALTTLIVGIASVTALFSLLYSYAYRPLPYKDANRIVAIDERHSASMLSHRGVSRDAARTILAAHRTFERTSVFENGRTRASIAGRPAADIGTLGIDTSFLPMLGVQPARGRAMSADEIENRAPVAMISDALWQSAFGGEESVVGRTIPIGEERVTIVGVMSPGFRFPNRTDMWRPRHALDSLVEPITLLGKMKIGIARRQVDAELASIGNRLKQIDSQQFGDVRLATIDMIERGLRDTLPVTSIFIIAALFVLLITCSNVANLQLVRAAERRGEMAVRASLGAGRGRLLMQALTESLVLSVLAGIGGVFASAALVKIILASVPVANFPSWLTFGVDGGILFFATGVVVVVTLGVGLRPAFEGMRFDLVRALKIGGDAGAGNRGVARSARRGIIFQLSLSVTLFVGAALLYQSYQRLSVVDVGYPADEIASLTPFPDIARYPTDTSRMRVALEMLEQTRRLAGVRTAAVRSLVGASVISTDTIARSKGQRVSRPDARLFVDGDTTRDREARRAIQPYPRYFTVSDDYFATLDLRILVGRSFSADDAHSALVAVLSKRFADVLWSGQNPIGHVIQLGASGRRVAIVGVVEDVRDLQGGPTGIQSVPRADAYFSTRQVLGSSPHVLARGSGDMTVLLSAMQAVARRVDSQIPVETHMLLHELELETQAIRLFGFLIGGFAMSGLILSMIGIYGVIAYGIAQRSREIGIRIALGGTSDLVLGLIVRDGLAFTTLGLVIGVMLSLGVGRLLHAFLFGVSATDPFTYLVVCLAFVGVALVACYLPARRVLRVDPIGALRAD